MKRNFEVALQFEDGVTRFINVADGEMLSDAAYRQKINIPLDCRDGACGTCRAYCESGSYEMDEDGYIEDALTEEEAEQGYVLACQCQPTSNGVYQIQSTSELCKIGPQTYSGTVSYLEKVSDSTFVLRLLLADEAQSLAFLSGQYVNLEIPGTTKIRSYSFSSAPNSNELEFIIRNVPSGAMSAHLDAKTNIGDAINFTGPYGSFYLRNLTQPALFLAGGTGIAPFKSMLANLTEQENTVSVRLVYGVTNEQDLVALEFLDEIKAQHAWFDYRVVVLNSDNESIRRGYVTDHIDFEWFDAETFDVYLCGPVPMVDAVQQWLTKQGITPTHFYYERFSPNVMGEAA